MIEIGARTLHLYQSLSNKSPERGLLQPVVKNGEYLGVEVNFTHLLGRGGIPTREAVIDYFKQQGFAMAVKLPYSYSSDGLIVVESSAIYRSAGFEEAVSKEFDPIPF